MGDIAGEVRRLICAQLCVVVDYRLTPAASFMDDLGADSRALVELTISFEETFNIEIPDEEADRIRTVGDAIESVQRYVGRSVVDEPSRESAKR